MDLKRIYFLKHGECEDEIDERHQGSFTPLSEQGIQQVALLAGRFSHTNFDTIISSPLERARESAEMIGITAGKPILYSDLFREIKLPTELEGQGTDDPAYDPLRSVLNSKWSLPAWHYSDEENFVMAKKRAVEALKFLQSRPEETIVVVSHEHFLTMLFLVMALGKMVTADEFLLFDTFSRLNSSSITLCEITDKGWKMRTWNDITHITEYIH